MAPSALLSASSNEGARLLAKARRTVAAVRAEAPALVMGDPDCSRRFTQGDAAIIETMFVGVLVDLQRVQERLAALEGR